MMMTSCVARDWIGPIFGISVLGLPRYLALIDLHLLMLAEYVSMILLFNSHVEHLVW